MPIGMGGQFGLVEPEKWLEFKGANGKIIDRFGAREIFVESKSTF